MELNFWDLLPRAYFDYRRTTLLHINQKSYLSKYDVFDVVELLKGAHRGVRGRVLISGCEFR